MDNLIRPKALAEKLDVSRTTIWRMIKRGELPAPQRISPGVVGWRESDVEVWLADRPVAPLWPPSSVQP